MAPSEVYSSKVRDHEISLEIFGFVRVPYRVFFWKFLSILFFPLLPLCLYWKPNWWTKAAYKKTPIQFATHLLVYRAEILELVDIFIIKENGAIIPASSKNRNETDESHLITTDDEPGDVRFFKFGAVRFIWNSEREQFVRQTALDHGYSINDIQSKFSSGLNALERDERRNLFGENSIEIEVKSYLKLFIEEVLNPFYIFQIFSVVLWLCDDYWSYAGAIFTISALSISVSLKKTKQQSQDLHDMVTDSSVMNRYNKDSQSWDCVDSRDLVPGDLVQIENGVLHADLLLLHGIVIVNEAMLTGESAPEQKEPANGILGFYHPDKHRRHTLFAGTDVVQARCTGLNTKVTAVVVRTGFSTAKGDLVRSIMFPAPIGFGFYDDAIRFICLLACLALLGDIYCFYLFYTTGAPWQKAILKILDLITVVVPPSLPAAMTIGTVYSQARLTKKKIFCISPPRINVAGKTKICCFDKTGTLTEEGLDFWGLLSGSDLNSDSILKNPKTELPNSSPLKQCMAACHSLTTIDGEFIGDPLDIKMFENTGWHYKESGDNDSMRFPVVKPITTQDFKSEDQGVDYTLAILKCFPFSSELQRQSVIVRGSNRKCPQLFLKGAPEAVAARCANMPAAFEDELAKLTRRGFRVLAMAEKEINLPFHKIDKADRSDCETDLNFLGLLIMQNQLKPKSEPILNELSQAGIRSLMVTGDNLLTGIAVSRDCSLLEPKAPVFIVSVDLSSGTPQMKIAREGKNIDHLPPADEIEQMVPETTVNSVNNRDCENATQNGDSATDELSKNWHFAISGKDWSLLRQHFPLRVPYIVQRGTVFARMSPDQKAQLIEELKKIDYQVVMCGDGANDCGALRAANVGVSLSDSEASVAAPFTASCGDISCIPILIREGRAALVTSFGIFKYMAMYSLIQFISVLILYTFGTNLGDVQFLWIDLAITTTVAVFMSRNGPHPKLVKRRPPGSLLNPYIIVSFLFQIIGVGVSQGGITFDLHSQPWFHTMDLTNRWKSDSVVGMDNTVIFILSSFQYMMLAFIFSIGPPYRTRIWRNIPFLGSLFVLAWLTTLIAISPNETVIKWFDLAINSTMVEEQDSVPLFYRWRVLGVVAVHFVFAIFCEEFVSKSPLIQKLVKMIRRKTLPKSKFKRIEIEIQSRSAAWLGVTSQLIGSNTTSQSDNAANTHKRPRSPAVK